MSQKFTKEQIAKIEAHAKNGHSGKMSRRELVGAGVIYGSAGVGLPSILETVGDVLGLNRAYGIEASECAAVGAPEEIPTHINIHLQSGWNASGAFLIPGKQALGGGMQFLSQTGYSTIGYGALAHPSALAPNMEFGAPAHANAAFTRVLSSLLPPDVKAKMQAGLIAGVTADDQPNPCSSEFLSLGSVGKRGGLVQIAQNINGGQYNPIAEGQDQSQTRALISNVNALALLVGAGQLGELFGGIPGALKIAKAIDSMGSARVKAFHAMGFTEQHKKLVECNYALSPQLIDKFTAANLSPANDVAFTTPLLGAQVPFSALNAAGVAGTTASTEGAALAIISKLCADGNARFGRIEMAGYDYHNNGRQDNDTKDASAARMVASVINAFALKGKPVFISLSTSGAVSCGGGQNPAATAITLGNTTALVTGKEASQADSSARSAVTVIAYHPTARPITTFTQVGAWNDGGAVVTDVATGGVTGNNQTNLAKAVAANYAAFAGKYKGFEEYLKKSGSANPFAGEEDKYIMFKRT